MRQFLPESCSMLPQPVNWKIPRALQTEPTGHLNLDLKLQLQLKIKK